MLLIALTLFSCSGDDDTNNETTEEVENFLVGYLEATGFNEEVIEEINTGFHFEFGLEFTPLVNGKITALKIMLPDANPTLRVTIWNKSTNTVIKTEVVNVASANTEFTFDITDLELVEYNEYAITMNSDDGYFRNNQLVLIYNDSRDINPNSKYFVRDSRFAVTSIINNDVFCFI